MTPEEQAAHDAARKAGEEAAARLTTEERARRARAAIIIALAGKVSKVGDVEVEGLLPQKFQRLPVEYAKRLTDDHANQIAEMMLTLLLEPGEPA